MTNKIKNHHRTLFRNLTFGVPILSGIFICLLYSSCSTYPPTVKVPHPLKEKPSPLPVKPEISEEKEEVYKFWSGTAGQYQKLVYDMIIQLEKAKQMKAAKKTGWKKMAKKQSEIDLFGQNTPAATALLAIERAKAYCLLEEYDEGLKELNRDWNLIKSLNAGYIREDMLYAAPSAKAYLWEGNLYLGKGGKTEDKEEKIKLYFYSAKNYYAVIKKYDQKKCPFTSHAIVGYNKAKDKLAALGKKIPQHDAVIKTMPKNSKERK